jgi:hypothetical protein
MKIIGHTITEKEADLFCERIFCLAQARPRLREILKLDSDPKHSPLAQKIAKQLVLGKLIVVDNNKNDVFFSEKTNLMNSRMLPSSPMKLPSLKSTSIITETGKSLVRSPSSNFITYSPN